MNNRGYAKEKVDRSNHILLHILQINCTFFSAQNCVHCEFVFGFIFNSFHNGKVEFENVSRILFFFKFARNPSTPPKIPVPQIVEIENPVTLIH